MTTIVFLLCAGWCAVVVAAAAEFYGPFWREKMRRDRERSRRAGKLLRKL